ncbi:YciI family protein [Prescottella agglutinans]|uniref:YciI family protein n=1 Tax=Prescottella agglutinans TaxID=1644129 RepID=A0A3S3E7P9_9NOCA|nr:YciI family protein [Prescottella agglutinans]RVW07254.1 YciI family protein [Prescottella agglutinans]
MKYMLIMRATDEAVEAYKDVPFEQVIEQMGRFNEDLMKAGVLLAGEGLSDAEEGFVVDFSGETPLVTDGPYGETKELFNGFWILEVASKEEAAEWAKRVPLGPGAKIEVRRVTGVEDFPQDNEWIQKEEGWREELEGRKA